MRKYNQLTSGERHELKALMRHESRNRACPGSTQKYDRARDRPQLQEGHRLPAQHRRRDDASASTTLPSQSAFTGADWDLVVARLEQEWSPEQISGRLARSGEFRIKPRDDLPLHLGGSTTRWPPPPSPPWRPEEAP
jgi:IS30 family transposase